MFFYQIQYTEFDGITFCENDDSIYTSVMNFVKCKKNTRNPNENKDTQEKKDINKAKQITYFSDDCLHTNG